MKLFLFNHYHNGDIFASKEFVRQIIDSYDWAEVKYFHENSPKLLSDLQVEYSSIFTNDSNIWNRNKYCVVGDTVYINTWVGNYLYGDCGINWIVYWNMFGEIFNWIESALGISIKLDINFERYVPTINFSKYEIEGIIVPDNSILISNGPALSGQSNTAGFDLLVQSIIESTNKNIILTHQSQVTSDRIFYTSNIIKASNGDLNEISFVAERCDSIIGRNSGPFCYAHTKSILNNKDKLLIAVGSNKKNCFPHGIRVDCEYKFVDDSDSMPKDDEVMRILIEHDKI